MHSEGWSIIAQRIQLMVEREVMELLKDQPEESTARRRGAVQMARTIAGLPEIIAGELRAKVAAEK